MVFDWVMLASVLTVLLMLWMLAYVFVYAFKHIAQESVRPQEPVKEKNSMNIK